MKRSVLLFVVGVVGAFATTFMVVGWQYELALLPTESKGWLGLLALMALTAGSSAAAIRFSTGRTFFSISLIPSVAVVPLFGPFIAILSTSVSEAVARILMRQSPVKAAFNTAQLGFAVGIGSIVYIHLGGLVSHQEFDLAHTLLPFAGLIVAYYLTNTGLVSSVIALDTGKSLLRTWLSLGPVTLVNDLASSTLALFVVYTFVDLGTLGLFVVLLPLIVVHHSYALYLRLLRQNREVLELLVKTIEAKDPYTSGHSQRVARLSREIAEAMQRPARQTDEIETAALLHDIGKIDFSYSEFIQSPMKLSDEQRDMIRSHPDRGAALLASLSSLSDTVLAGVRHHHEHFDGSGYPDGLVGEEIPFPARVIMVADTVDAMLSHRPYRPALGTDRVTIELKKFSGRQFDPRIVDVFITAGLVDQAAARALSSRFAENRVAEFEAVAKQEASAT